MKSWAAGNAVRLAVCLIFGNLLFWSLKPGPLVDLSNSDEQQLHFLFGQPDAWPRENGVDTFDTYGPMVRLLAGWNEAWPLAGWLAVMGAMLLWCLVLWMFMRRASLSLAPAVLLVFFAVGHFYFPFFDKTPLIMMLWAFATPDAGAGRRRRGFHQLTGALIAAMLFLYKPSLGQIAGLQIAVTALTAPGSENWRQRLRWLCLTGGAAALLSLLLYLAVTQRGTPGSFWLYARVVLNDSASYEHFAPTPQYHDGNWLFLCFPLLMFSVFAALLFFRVEGRRFWLALLMLPVLYGEYKHSYVRADDTNIQVIFFMFPLALFFALLRFWSTPALRYFLLAGLAVLGAMSYSDSAPSNVPYKYPRRLYIKSPSAYAAMKLDHAAKSEANLRAYLDGYDWIRKQVAGRTLLTLPLYPGRARLGEPWLLPSHMGYLGFGDSLRSQLDVSALLAAPPEYVLLENEQLDQRPPMSNRRVLFEEILEHYRCVGSDDRNFLFRRALVAAELRRTALAEGRIVRGRYGLSFSAPGRALLYLRASGLDTPGYRLRSLLLKGDKIHLLIGREGGEDTHYFADIPQLEQGFIFPLDFPALAGEDARRAVWHLRIEGTLLANYRFDPAHYLHSAEPEAGLSVGLVEATWPAGRDKFLFPGKTSQ